MSERTARRAVFSTGTIVPERYPRTEAAAHWQTLARARLQKRGLSRQHLRILDPTVADVLASEPTRRSCWMQLHRRSGDVVHTWSGPCANLHCPNCVAHVLSNQAARAFAAWGERPVRVLDDEAWRLVAGSEGYKLRGPNAVPGIVVLPVGYDGERVAFVPGDGGLTGPDLAEALFVAQLRHPVEIEEVRGRADEPDAFTTQVSAEVVSQAYEHAGIEVDHTLGPRWAYWRGRGVTDEKWQLFRDYLARAPDRQLLAA